MANTERGIFYPISTSSGDLAAHMASQASTTETAITSASVGMKNVIINGGFDIWQRGTSFSASGYSADRWLLALGSGAAGSVSRGAGSGAGWVGPAAGTRLRSIMTWSRTVAGTAETFLGQRVEDVHTLNGSTVTVSFIAWTASGLIDLEVKTQQYFGPTGNGASAAVYTGSSPITINSTPTRYSYTFALQETATKTTYGSDHFLMLYFSRAHNATNGATGTMHITGVQMERGPAATPFETRPQALELAMCQRYYYRIQASGSDFYFVHGIYYGVGDPRGAFFVMKHPVDMRGLPALEYSNLADFKTWYYDGTPATMSIDATSNSPRQCRLNFTYTGGTAPVSGAGETACALGSRSAATPWMAFSAEIPSP